MGCDIHLVLERKHGLQWVAIDTFVGHEGGHGKGWSSPAARSRNYERFAALANVRSGDDAGPEPRGLPDNPSDTTRLLLEDWSSDAHSISWLPLAEAAQIFLATERGERGDFVNKYPQSHFFGVDESDHPNREYRLIFWFDN